MLMIHAGPVKVQRRPVWIGYQLANHSTIGLPFQPLREWRPCVETFLSWLVHHQIAYDMGRGLYMAHHRADEIARLPNRNRVYLLGKLILEREGEVVTDPPDRSRLRR